MSCDDDIFVTAKRHVNPGACRKTAALI